MAWGSRFVQARSRVQLQALRVCLEGRRKADSGLAHVAPGPTFLSTCVSLPWAHRVGTAREGHGLQGRGVPEGQLPTVGCLSVIKKVFRGSEEIIRKTRGLEFQNPHKKWGVVAHI